MVNNNIYIAPQQLQDVGQAYGSIINQIVDRLFAKLQYGAAMPWYTGAQAPRAHVELREAKTLIRQLRYRDSSTIRIDEMAWALKTIKDACATDVFGAHIDAFDKAAEMLGIDLVNQLTPSDMQRKIDNEMQLFSGILAPMALAQAV